jgi:hypothetical protein
VQSGAEGMAERPSAHLRLRGYRVNEAGNHVRTVEERVLIALVDEDVDAVVAERHVAR